MTAAVDVRAVRAALLTQADAEGAQLVVTADEQAARRLELAEQEAAALIERAREEGRAAAELEAERERGRARREAHALALRARGRLYAELRRDARAAVLALRQEPAYAELLERLAARARRQLGEEAVVRLDPPGLGGVLASADSRAVDYSLAALADRCLAALGPEVERLWS